MDGSSVSSGVNLAVGFGHWLQNRPFALSIAGSDWSYPFVQATHFTGLSLFVGTNIVVDLSLMGKRKKSSAPLQLSDMLFVCNWTVSAQTYLTNMPFLTKLGLLIPLALVLHIVVQRKAPEWEKASETPSAAKIAGFAELLLWLCVATAAVLIPYVG